MKNFGGAVTLTALMLAVSMPAGALVIDSSSIGASGTVQWLLAAGDTDPNTNTNNTGQDISAEAVFQVLDFDIDNDFIDLQVTARNTTAPNDDQVGLYKIGFGTSPDATGVAFDDDPTDGEFVDATLGYASQFPDKALIDVTSWTGPGRPRTLQAGEQDTFGLRLTFADLLVDSQIVLSPFNAAFQSDPDSFQVRGSETPPTPVPAPGTLILLGAGLLGLARWRSAPKA